MKFDLLKMTVAALALTAVPALAQEYNSPNGGGGYNTSMPAIDFSLDIGYAGLGTADWGGTEGYGIVQKEGGSDVVLDLNYGSNLCPGNVCGNGSFNISANVFEKIRSAGEALSTESGNPAYVINNGATKIEGSFMINVPTGE